MAEERLGAFRHAPPSGAVPFGVACQAQGAPVFAAGDTREDLVRGDMAEVQVRGQAAGGVELGPVSTGGVPRLRRARLSTIPSITKRWKRSLAHRYRARSSSRTRSGRRSALPCSTARWSAKFHRVRREAVIQYSTKSPQGATGASLARMMRTAGVAGEPVAGWDMGLSSFAGPESYNRNAPITSASTATAISSGVRAPMGSPMGPWIRSRTSAENPTSPSLSRLAPCVLRLPSAPT